MNLTERAATVLQEIDAALAICEKATVGPWSVNQHEQHGGVRPIKRASICAQWANDKSETLLVAVVNCDRQKTIEADAAFIASARTVCPTALRCLKTAIERQLKRYLSNRRFMDDPTRIEWQDLNILITQWNSK